MLSNKCLVASYISPLEPKIIKLNLEKLPPNPKLFRKKFNNVRGNSAL